MKSIGVTLQCNYLTKNCKKETLRDIQLSFPIFLVQPTDPGLQVLSRWPYHQCWLMGATLIVDDPELIIYQVQKDGRLLQPFFIFICLIHYLQSISLQQFTTNLHRLIKNLINKHKIQKHSKSSQRRIQKPNQTQR